MPCTTVCKALHCAYHFQVKFVHLLSRFNNRARYTVDFGVKNVKYDEEAIDKDYFKR